MKHDRGWPYSAFLWKVKNRNVSSGFVPWFEKLCWQSQWHAYDYAALVVSTLATLFIMYAYVNVGSFTLKQVRDSLVTLPVHLTSMKVLVLLLFFAFGTAAAWQKQPIEPPNDKNKNKICWVGSLGTYIRENDECIDTQTKCEAKGGQWGGVVSGRGRSPGCNLPTNDAGKKCSDSSQCESVCIAHDESNKNCSCYPWTRLGKGLQSNQCSSKGIIYGPIVD